MSSAGYPTTGSVRPASVVYAVDLQGREVLVYANDNSLGVLNRPLNTLSPSETFLRADAERRFGRKAVLELAEREAEKLLAPKLPILEVLTLGLVAYDIYNVIVPGGPLPRDPNNRSDSDISVPLDGSWTITDYQDWKSAPADWGTDGVETTTLRYRSDVMNGVLADADFPGASGIEYSAEQIIGLDVHAFTKCIELSDAHVGSLTYYELNFPADTQPFYTNPPRTADDTVQAQIAPRPVELPRPTYAELPYIARHPWSEVGPVPGEVPNGAPEPYHEPGPISPPTIVIADPPVPVVGTGPGLGPGQSPSPGSSPVSGELPEAPPRKPPGSRTKERKVRIHLPGGVSGALRVVELVPELLDAINALWQVLPKSCKSGYYKLHGKGGRVYYKKRWRASQWQRMQDLYRCWTHINMEDGLKALLANQLEDRFYGTIGQVSKRAARHLGDQGYSDRPVGFQAGPWDTEPGKLDPDFQSPLDFNQYVDWFDQGLHAVFNG